MIVVGIILALGLLGILALALWGVFSLIIDKFMEDIEL